MDNTDTNSLMTSSDHLLQRDQKLTMVATVITAKLCVIIEGCIQTVYSL